MPPLYPEIKANSTHTISVSDVHTLYAEECGSQDGIPVLFLHGGPGAGIERYHRRFFDPERYRMILFDQRGSGKSVPHACLEDNTTQHLVEDIETLRRHFGIDKWIVFGGSWGSTLALVYAQTHPAQVKALVIRGIFMCRKKEIDWIYQEGASRIYPDFWEDFIAPIPKEKRHDMVNAYYKILTGDNDIARMSAAKAWSVWEGRTATLAIRSEVVEHFSHLHTALSVAMIECHYFVNNSFLEEDQILKNIDKIRHIPTYIVQGRYDMICPMESAFELHKAWPESELTVVKDAGHAASEPGIVNALVSIMNKLAFENIVE